MQPPIPRPPEGGGGRMEQLKGGAGGHPRVLSEKINFSKRHNFSGQFLYTDSHPPKERASPQGHARILSQTGHAQWGCFSDKPNIIMLLLSSSTVCVCVCVCA